MPTPPARPSKAGRPSSINDVARLAGVSPQTVSRVSRGSSKVRPDTRAKVENAMRQLGYVPNRAARALRSGSYHTIGVLTQQVERTGEARTLSGVLSAARDRGFAVTVTQVAHPEAEEVHSAVTDLVRQPVEGLVIVQSGRATAEHLALPPSLAVASSDSALVGYYPSASADQVHGVHEAVDHLLDLGHRTVHHVTGPADAPSAVLRRSAWRARLEQRGRAVPEPVIGGWAAQDGYRAGQDLAARPDVTAVLCANDEVAVGLIRAMHEHSRDVPREVSVVGFDDLPLGEFLAPALTTVRIDFHRAGTTMVDLIAEQIEGGVADGMRRLTIPTELIVRASTAPPAHG
ncbi:LacI family DNA-binding transcriptional regulator [Actinomyces haliotis]|uniref:LacI family DNA-binding transcriptional regulator n=1 Tax=Actinomyces haliotis TaxID=1280843 RepID=UPI001E430435|nr:LacI family DNA-binding transcriptional regulator [Actinomyces haliotis]